MLASLCLKLETDVMGNVFMRPLYNECMHAKTNQLNGALDNACKVVSFSQYMMPSHSAMRIIWTNVKQIINSL